MTPTPEVNFLYINFPFDTPPDPVFQQSKKQKFEKLHWKAISRLTSDTSWVPLWGGGAEPIVAVLAV